MRIAHTCARCAADLSRLRAPPDPVYGLPVVVCPSCGLAAVRRLTLERWRGRGVRRLAVAAGLAGAQRGQRAPPCPVHSRVSSPLPEADTMTEPGVAAPTLAGPKPGTPPVAELRGLRKTYYKPDGTVMVEALKGVDLAIGRGEYVAIMGASGSGKSTLMNVLGCLDQPTKGDYFLDGVNIREMTDTELSIFRGQKIGFVFQAFNLISELVVEENVEVPLFYQGVGRAERRRRAVEALGLVGLGDRLGHRPSELSGGQQQRVAIARALVTRPVVLMADEPTGNLDSTTGESILKLFERLNDEGMTIIMVTHDDDIAHRCERVIRLRDGVVEVDRRNPPRSRAIENA